MKPSANFYQEKLYPLQDGVMKIVKGFRAPFYLSGGTALSRFHLNHRYSDDLDFFLNGFPDFSQIQPEIITLIREGGAMYHYSLIDEKIFSSRDYLQVLVSKEDFELKLDFVNDVCSHTGALITDEQLGRIDNMRNILSNKLSAIYRLEVKDFVDIWAISKKMKFNWRVIINEAKEKEPTVDANEIFNLFVSFPFSNLSLIKWTSGFKYEEIESDFKILAGEILNGTDNSLFRNR